MWTFISETMPKAKKAHHCFLCGHAIPVGTKHVKRVGVDGEWLTVRMHEQCDAVTHDWDEDDWEAMPDERAFCHEDLAPETLAEIVAQEKVGNPPWVDSQAGKDGAE